MKIHELAKQLELAINNKINDLKETGEQYKTLTQQLEQMEAKLIDIYEELKPVEYMIAKQNPQTIEFFGALGNLSSKKQSEKKKK